MAFLSSSLPCVKEFAPQLGFSYTNNTQSTSASVPIITDFVPLLQFAGDQRGDFVYNPSGPYRLVNLNSSQPLSAIDLRIVWFDQYNRQYPIILEPGKSASIKFMFVKKSSYRDLYN